MYGTVFNIQRFSLFDGPGVRTVVFLKGCPLRCIWCHNPEGISPHPQVMFEPGKCIACGACAEACPKGLHRMMEGGHAYLRSGCDGCGSCVGVCCTQALSMAGRRMDIDSVLREVMRDLPVYRESGGGMTLSGGEPLLQADFAIDLLRAAKEEGISTCIETSGQASAETLLEAARYTDYFYYDYKATGEEMHRRLCGASQRRILENLAALNGLGAHVTLRCPIVDGANDTPQHIQGIADTAAAYACIRQVHLEPYHRLGVTKSAQLGAPPSYDGAPPDRARLETYCAQIESASGKSCIIS